MVGTARYIMDAFCGILILNLSHAKFLKNHQVNLYYFMAQSNRYVNFKLLKRLLLRKNPL